MVSNPVPAGSSLLPPIEASDSHPRSASWHPKGQGHRLLYKEWEEKFKKEYEAETLEERKKRLEEIRSLKKPMTKEEMEEHARQYEQMREEHKLKHMEEMREKQRVENYKVTAQFRTRAYEEVAKQKQA